MRTILPTLLIALSCLTACNRAAPNPGVMLEEVLQRDEVAQWKVVAMRLKVYDAPLDHQQLTYAVFQSVQHCAEMRLAPHLDLRLESAEVVKQWYNKFDQVHKRCQDIVLSQALSASGADQAHKVSLAMKSINPNFKRTVLPSYVTVD